MKKKNIDWASLDFSYRPTDYRFVAIYKDGAWDEGFLSADANVTMSEGACVLHYAQTVFEGLKAYTTPEGKIVIFRPDLNAKRMADSCARMRMPVFPEDKFIDAVEQVVRANAAWVPPYGSGASLYLRPVMFGFDSVMGVKPAKEFELRIFACPVGPYFKGGIRPLNLRISDLDRAAPKGTGHIKAGLNYAMSLYNIVDAHEKGYDENIYVDAATRSKIEETGGANIIFVTKDGKVVVPKSDSILPSITRRSLVEVARNLGIKTVERPVKLTEIGHFSECGLCGTAAVISPVGTIDDHGTVHTYAGYGPVIERLYKTLTGIQMGAIPAPKGWLRVICE